MSGWVQPPNGWYAFGTHAGWDEVPPLEFSDETGEDGLPLFERPAAKSTPTEREGVADELVTYECDKRCGFYKNVHEGPCRLLGCGGTVRAVRWVRRDALAPLIAERERRAAYFAMWQFFLRLPSPTPLSDAVQREAMRLRAALAPESPTLPQIGYSR